MKQTPQSQYHRIAEAIHYIKVNYQQQPSLDDIAEAVGLSAFHFQRLFTDWAGVSPKQFIQYLSIEHAKKLLIENKQSLLDTAYNTGLSGTGRLHDLFIKIEGMTPGEYKNGGENLNVSYSFMDSPFGKLIVASTQKGICHMHFEEDTDKALTDLTYRFPNANFTFSSDEKQQQALKIFQKDWRQLDQIKLHLKATQFQLKVWQVLLTIPSGSLTSYGNIAQKIQQPKAARAVGTAVAKNPVAFLIPCHRVIQASGALGEYMWGSTRKSAIIGWESS